MKKKKFILKIEQNNVEVDYYKLEANWLRDVGRRGWDREDER